MKKYRLMGLISVVLLLLTTPSFAQPTENSLVLAGYEKKVSGTDFSYHSSVPGVKSSLLVRADNGKHIMEWETEAVPADMDKEYATFVWLAGMGSHVATVPMHMYVDGERVFTFHTRQKKSWSLEGKGGMTLTYHHDGYDQNKDQYGFMFLRVPARKLDAGQHLRLKVRGGNEGSTAWYMTFKGSLKNNFRF